MGISESKKQLESVETTIGELVEIITALAREVGRNEKEANELASLTLESILRKNKKELSMFLE